jgi:pimeloyl-ACP methyl ester carboxylesterase
VRDFGKSLWEYAAANEVNTLPERVKDLAVPLLGLAGDKDQVIPLGDSQLLAETVKRGQFVLLEDCGHLPQEEKPQEMVQAIQAFVEHLRK